MKTEDDTVAVHKTSALGPTEVVTSRACQLGRTQSTLAMIEVLSRKVEASTFIAKPNFLVYAMSKAIGTFCPPALIRLSDGNGGVMLKEVWL